MNTVKPRGVVVVGSANMDIVFTVERIPVPGETLLAQSSSRYPGGKGLNQAVASVRAGAPTTLIAALGNDDNGDVLADVMTSAGIATKLVRREGTRSGLAFIVVDGAAENTIIVDSGANAGVTALTREDRDAIESGAVLLMQLELPLSVVQQAATVAHAAGRTVMLNAAPATQLDDRLLAVVDYLMVNEHEARLMAGVDDLAEASLAVAARVRRVVVTLGADGAAYYDEGVKVGEVTPPHVTPVDTTGAGDTFCGAFAAAIAEGQDLTAAARFATAAAALSVESLGAVPSIPGRERIEAALV
ncbi:MAG: ribokinase [Homoserinimonas sp.]|jgi:ribokinase|nr:ribokinase [Homoserinimonas sp.]